MGVYAGGFRIRVVLKSPDITSIYGGITKAVLKKHLLTFSLIPLSGKLVQNRRNLVVGLLLVDGSQIDDC